jgi:hypothetical protein
MSILVLGSHSYTLVPDVNGDPLTVSAGGLVPAVTSGSGTPVSVPTYGEGTLYVDTTNYILYIYKSSSWSQVGAALPNNLIYMLTRSTVPEVITAAGPTNTFSYTVPGGTLGIDKVLRLKLSGLWKTAGNARTVTIAVSYGGTTLWSDTSTNLSANKSAGWSIEVNLIANNSTTSQELTGVVSIGSTGAATTGATGDLSTDEILGTAVIVSSTSSVNSDSGQSLNVSVTFSGSGSTWTKYYHSLELL